MWKPEILVLGPGGIKGFLELGALHILESKGLLTNVNTFVGVSVGAIISLLIVSGYSITEIIAEAADADIFNDLSSVSVKDTREKLGLVSSAPIKRKLLKNVIEKFGYVPTLSQLFRSTGLKLVCVTANLDKERPEYMSYETEPDISCVDAVMYSMNIPIIFYKLKYKGCVYVDGALGNPYPLDQYDDGNTNILGIYIESTCRTDHEPADSTTTMYFHKIIHFTMSELRRRIIKACSERCKHLCLPSKIVDSTGLSIDADLKAAMILSGYECGSKFIKELEDECDEETSKDDLTDDIELDNMS